MTEVSTEAKAAGMSRPLLNGGPVLLALGGVMCMAGGLATTAAPVDADGSPAGPARAVQLIRTG